MEDELEDRILYQTYLSHVKMVSRLAVGLPLNSTHLSHVWRILRLYVLKPEVLIFSALLLILLVYMHSVEVWSRSLLTKLHLSIGSTVPSKVHALQYLVKTSADVEKLSWELKAENVAVYAVQGRRDKMEDRFVVNQNINGSGVSLYAVFDGHGGEFAANYARDNLVNNLNNKVVELKKLVLEGGAEKSFFNHQRVADKPPGSPLLSTKKMEGGGGASSVERRQSFKKTASVTDEAANKKLGGAITDPFLLEKLESLNRPITREVRPTRKCEVLPPPNISSYLEQDCSINYGRLLTDEVLAADRLLVEAAKKTMDVAGTTALIALVEGSRLIVANVGDSRGVMCDSKGNAIPLSFDHKPQQMREQKRIKEAGGFITFNGVWRVAGILATSRALGDYPLKDKRLVIADPDILTFRLDDHRPQFLVLASDGLWDKFTNEEAVAFIKSRLDEPHFGAKSIALQAYLRGSFDNITVLVINLSNHKWPVAAKT